MRRATTFAIGAAAVVVLAATVISSSRAIAPRAGQSASPEDEDAGDIDMFAVAGPTPTPLPCPGCWKLEVFIQNFDGMTPPALPTSEKFG